MRERREFERWKISRGHAEITNVAGPGADRCPRGQVRIVNWSRGGLCLKIPSPSRKMLLFKNEPVLTEDDSIYCSLRFPPHYRSLDVCADVVRVERDDDDPGALRVGLAFDESVPPPTISALAELLERKSKSGRTSARSARVSSGKTKSGRRSGTSKRVRASNETQRIRAHGGGLSERVKSQRLRAPSSGEGRSHRPAGRSARVTQAQQTLAAAEESVRQAKESLRLAIESLQVARDSRQIAREQVARESGRQKRVSTRALRSSAEGIRDSQRLAKASRRSARESQRLRRR